MVQDQPPLLIRDAPATRTIEYIQQMGATYVQKTRGKAQLNVAT